MGPGPGLRTSVARDLTRRGLLAGAGALLLAPRVVHAATGGEAVFTARLPASGRLEPKRTFELVGMEGGAGGERRARNLDGCWTDWFELPHSHADGALSDPVWLGPSNGLEVRSKHALRSARIVLVNGGSLAPASASKRYGATNLAGAPPIIARSTWATSACKPRVPAVFGAVEVAFVHHTVNSNSYRAGQSASMIRSICLFHKYGNGWNDIGYNFVVDRFGQIFEGRAGGVSEAIAGAQAGGYNFHSTGIAMLGNFSYGGPPRKMFDALAGLLAWKLTLHGVKSSGKTTIAVSQAGAPYSRYRAGTRVKLNRISGHRDGDTTTCPGSGMYRQLPRLRQVVGRRVTDIGSLTFALQSSTPGSVTVAGGLASEPGPIAGVAVDIERRSTTRGPATLATATTNSDGTWSAQVPLTDNADLRAVFRGDGVHPAVVSPGILATVPPQITLSASAQLTVPGGVVDFSGATSPVKPKISIVVSQQQSDGSLAPVRTIRVNAADDGSFARSIGFANPGQYQVIAHTAADA